MYNSVLVRFLVKIWKTLESWYETSLVKRISSSIKNFFRKLSYGSVIKSIFKKDLDIIENTWFYKLYSKFIDFYNGMFEKGNKNLKEVKKGSIYSRTMDGLFKNNLELIKTFSIFFMFFGVGVIINSFVRGIFLSGSVIGSLVLILLAIIILNLDEKVIDILENSWLVDFTVRIFKVEEGGDQWW